MRIKRCLFSVNEVITVAAIWRGDKTFPTVYGDDDPVLSSCLMRTLKTSSGFRIKAYLPPSVVE